MAREGERKGTPVDVREGKRNPIYSEGIIVWTGLFSTPVAQDPLPPEVITISL